MGLTGGVGGTRGVEGGVGGDMGGMGGVEEERGAFEGAILPVLVAAGVKDGGMGGQAELVRKSMAYTVDMLEEYAYVIYVCVCVL